MRSTLRPITIQDVDFMIQLVSKNGVTSYLPGMITNREMMEDWINDLGPSDREYIVMLGRTEIGECSLTLSPDHTAEIGFMILPEYWKQGYGTEVVMQLVEKSRQMSIVEMTATTDVRNEAAIRLLTKTGFQKHNIGWMLAMPEDGEELPKSQTVVQFKRTMKQEEDI